ncbi:type II secretion system minor pseudopilin GspK [Citrobacter rodentium]|uniref:Type II secretion system protein K n=2 Tax=Citrobacter rodentium TaxID=67825 RepID=D2TMH1_CITRI|nr:type II secretion system minor pseudopilin GspK [Citrobacter rodentium]KIQ52829.1 T2SS protein K [Citrobacter rodentium]QBY30755.1 general secretion pathway protein GspK [Citrobacter rodentium]UHO31878.1 type II secretion system minor pseudopilin GspK [Citrobacter rodentium NBRC 105723 = DSM 16636]CBG91185.1 putative T2SS protein K [Citrobacter rodentium ICC168]HAT8014557.1 general secretion pathway protein GspK [Citrobacter rodentium NBRC 105723 = DSM 16636]
MQNERGSALLVTLLMLALMAALAAELTIGFQTQLQRSRRVNASLQTKFALLYAEKRAINTLQTAVLAPLHEQPDSEDLGEETTVSWRAQDQQRCFNLNALANAPEEPLAEPPYEVKVFSALLEKSNVDGARAEEIIQSLADDIDTNNTPRLRGAEDEYYQRKSGKGFAANQLLLTVDEARQVKGMTEAIFQRLSPFICTQFSNALSVNVNALTERDAPLLAALFLNEISDSDAKALLRKRPEEGWQNVDAFLYQAQKEYSATKTLVDALKKMIGVQSQYFRVDATARHGEFTVGMRSWLYYDEKNKTLRTWLRQLTAGDEE